MWMGGGGGGGYLDFFEAGLQSIMQPVDLALRIGGLHLRLPRHLQSPCQHRHLHSTTCLRKDPGLEQPRHSSCIYTQCSMLKKFYWQ